MKKNLLQLDLEILKNLYATKESEIESAILSGASWEEVRIQRQTLSDLSLALHHKLQHHHNASPADFPLRPRQ